MGPEFAKFLLDMLRYEKTSGCPKIDPYYLPTSNPRILGRSIREGLIRHNKGVGVDKGRLTQWGRQVAAVILANANRNKEGVKVEK